MIEQLFFELIRVAIGTRDTLSRAPSAQEWRQLYDIAKKQSLVGVCFASVQKLNTLNPSNTSNLPEASCETKASPKDATHNLSELQYLTWMGMAAKIQQRNEIVNAQCVEVQQMIEKAGFRTFIMKGQGNSALYRTSNENDNENENLCLLRQSGDIDIYLEGGFEKVNAFVQRTCPTREINELEIHYHCLPDTEVEIHYRPFIMRNPLKNRKLQRFFADEGERCFKNRIALPNGVGEIVAPTNAFNLVHQLVHTYHHFITEGVGLRQLMDYYFVVLAADKEVQKFQIVSEVQRVVENLGLSRFASALMWGIAHVFANDNENFYPWKPNEKDGRMLLEEILKSGNFGHTDERAKDIQTSRWKAFWFVNGKTFRFWRFDHWAWFWSPVWRAYHFLWRKFKSFK